MFLMYVLLISGNNYADQKIAGSVVTFYLIAKLKTRLVVKQLNRLTRRGHEINTTEYGE